MRKRKGLRKN